MGNHDSADYQLETWFYVNPGTRLLSCQSVNKWMLHGFVKIDTWISLSYFMGVFKSLHGFVSVVQCISRPLPKKLNFDQDFKTC